MEVYYCVCVCVLCFVVLLDLDFGLDESLFSVLICVLWFCMLLSEVLLCGKMMII